MLQAGEQVLQPADVHDPKTQRGVNRKDPKTQTGVNLNDQKAKTKNARAQDGKKKQKNTNNKFESVNKYFIRFCL